MEHWCAGGTSDPEIAAGHAPGEGALLKAAPRLFDTTIAKNKFAFSYATDWCLNGR